MKFLRGELFCVHRPDSFMVCSARAGVWVCPRFKFPALCVDFVFILWEVYSLLAACLVLGGCVDINGVRS